MAVLRHLHGGGMGVAVYSDDFAAIANQFQGDFAAQLAGAQQHDAGGVVGERGANDSHNRSQYVRCPDCNEKRSRCQRLTASSGMEPRVLCR